MRHIEPKMIEFFDEKLKDNEIAKIAFGIKNPRMLFVEAMRSLVGIRETTNHNDGPIIELIQMTIGTAERESYCMAAQQTGIAYAEVKTGIKSPIFAGEGCTEVWEETPRIQRVKYNPLPGALPIWQYHGTWKGHVEMVLAADENIMQNVGANTRPPKKDGVVVSNGDGIYFTERLRVKRDTEKTLLGFLKPF